MNKPELLVNVNDPWLQFFGGLLGLAGIKDEDKNGAAVGLIEQDIYRLYAEEAWKLLTDEAKRELANRIGKLLIGPKHEQHLDKAVARIVDGIIARHFAARGDTLVGRLTEKLDKAFDEQIERKARQAVEIALDAALRDLKAKLTK